MVPWSHSSFWLALGVDAFSLGSRASRDSRRGEGVHDLCAVCNQRSPGFYWVLSGSIASHKVITHKVFFSVCSC